VDDVSRGQLVAECHLGLSGSASAQFSAFVKKSRPGCPMDRPINTAAAEQRLVRGVNDGIDVQLRDVTFNYPHPITNAASHPRLLYAPNA
jgi:hypothetical protein